jgi:hypothetical protein
VLLLKYSKYHTVSAMHVPLLHTDASSHFFKNLVCEMKPMLVRCFSGRACFARDLIWRDHDTLDISRD